MAGTAYGKFPLHLCRGEVNLLTANLKAMLVDSTYTFDVHNHEFVFDLSGSTPVTSEVVGTGYTAGGVALANRALTYDQVLRSVKLTADAATFGALTVDDISGLIVYVDNGSPQANLLVAYHSMATTGVQGEAFTYFWHADGVVNLTV